MKSQTRLLMALTIAVCSFAAFATTAWAAPPPNDNFADAQAISPLAGYWGSNVDSTTESSTDPTEAGRLQAITGWGFFNTVWHRYEATATGDVSFTVCSNFPFNLVATSGEEIPTLSGTTPAVGPAARQGTSTVGVDDPSGCDAGQYAGTVGPFPVGHGTTIRPVVASAFSNQTGFYTINTTFDPTPVNDDFVWSRTIASRLPQSGSNRAATVELDEANNPYTNYRTVWHRYSAIGDGTADIEVCADFPVNLVAYSGWSYPLTPIAQAPQPTAGGCGASRYRVLLDDVPTSLDMPVNIQVGGYSSLLHVGDYDIEVRHNSPPASDYYLGSRNIYHEGGTEYDDNTFAANSHAFNENPFPTAGKRIHFHAHVSGKVGEFRFNTCGTAIDTVSAVYNFPNTYNLWSPSAYADGGCPSGGGDVLPYQWSDGSLGVAAMMQVASKNDGPGGPITASFEWQPEAGNNNFAAATDIGAGQSIAGSTKGANSEGAEPNNALGGKHRSVWYRFTAPSNGAFGFDTCDADFDSVVATWSGSDLGSLAAFGNGTVDNGCESGDGSKVGLRRVNAGEIVHIAVYGAAADERGDFTAELTFEESPPNDEWADATDLGNAETVNLDDDNGWATVGQPSIGGQYRNSSVWYRWTAPATDSYLIDTCSGPANGGDAFLAVFATNDPNPSTSNIGEAAVDDDSCDGDRPKFGKLTLNATAGKTYWIVFSAHSSSNDFFTEFTLKISSPPTNTSLPTISGSDNFVGTEFTAGNGAWSGTSPFAYTYEWLRCSDPDTCVAIDDADEGTYTPTGADVGSSIRVRVTATNAAGQRSATSANTSTIDNDSDGDGVGDVGDDCNFVQDDGEIKENGCLEESVAITGQPTLSSSLPRAGVALSASAGSAENNPGDDSSVPAPTGSTFTWHSCTSPTDEGTCVTRTPAGDNDTYTPVAADVGRYLRASQVFSNDDGGTATTWSEAGSAAAPPDSDGDGVIDDDDNCNFVQSGTVKANGCVSEGIAITANPSISGTAQVGTALTLALGSAENDPGDDAGVAAPTSTTYWYSCSSADNPASCAVRSGSANSYTPTAADIGRFIRSEVEWSNSDSASASTYSAATAAVIAAPVVPEPPATPPAAVDPLTLPTLPNKGSFKGAVKKKGAISLPKYKITCAAGSVTCKVTVTIVFKKKTIGKLSYTIVPGTTQPVKTKLTKAGLKLFKKSKKIKTELTITGTGGGTGKATFKEFTITK